MPTALRMLMPGTTLKRWFSGLRGKSLLVMGLICLCVFLVALGVGWQVAEALRSHFGEAYARNLTLLNQQRILTPVSRELALSVRLAGSQLTRQWLQDPDNPEKRARFFEEARGFQRDFRDHAYFIVHSGSGRYYHNADSQPFSEAPRYVLNPQDPADGWFFATLRNTRDYNINVNPDEKLKVTKVWFNVLVRDGDKDGGTVAGQEGGNKIGLTGAGLDLSAFLRDFIRNDTAGVTPMILDRASAIQAHPDPALIAYNSATRAAAAHQTLYGRLAPQDAGALQATMLRAEARPGEVVTVWLSLEGRRQLLALSFMPQLGWHVLTAVDLNAAQVIDRTWLLLVAGLVFAMLLLLFVGLGYAVERLVLLPLRQLQVTAGAMASGQYTVSLPPSRADEIGDLSRAFAIMAKQVQAHTAELEQRVQERTESLAQANRHMAAARKKLDDSIACASLLQHAILPSQQMQHDLGEHQAVLWLPRDVVGGDFYVYRAEEGRCLLGVVDCAGHGVPGALMTMLAHAAIYQALSDCGLADPAAVLARSDQILRDMLRSQGQNPHLATNMDVGLLAVDFSRQQLHFAGARMALYFTEDSHIRQLPGARRALADKRQGQYANATLALHVGQTFYLTSDGFLDQSGGELGYSFGDARFENLLREQAAQPLATQVAAFEAALRDYRGPLPQRDDITVLCFRPCGLANLDKPAIGA